MNLRSGFVVSVVRTVLFFATFDRIEQLPNEAEFFTCTVLHMLSGTVHAELKEDERCTGMLDTSFSEGLSFACLRDTFGGDVTSVNFFPISVTVEDCCFFDELLDTSDDEEE